jgi:hypothetical protein
MVVVVAGRGRVVWFDVGELFFVPEFRVVVLAVLSG